MLAEDCDDVAIKIERELSNGFCGLKNADYDQQTNKQKR
jgi:hypothetical protein